MTAFAVLKLARDAPFARQMINAGLSTATTYQTPLSTPDVDVWQGSDQLGVPYRTCRSRTPMVDRRPFWTF
jgi:3-(3-hydroxy-phenyl)propionate hydroxylase